MKSENNSFPMGVRDGLPICLGYLSVSFAFGIFATGMGLSVFEALLISMFNVTSAGQLAATPIIAAGGSFIEVAMTQLVINLRYSLMSVSLSQRLAESIRVKDRFLIAFVNTDEVFAVASSKGTLLGRKYMFGLILMPYIGWSIGTLVGAAAGKILPLVIVSALSIAIYAMFVAIVVPEAKKNRKTAFLSLTAIALSCLFNFAPVLKNIPSGFIIIICSVAVSALFAVFAPIDDGEFMEGEENV